MQIKVWQALGMVLLSGSLMGCTAQTALQETLAENPPVIEQAACNHEMIEFVQEVPKYNEAFSKLTQREVVGLIINEPEEHVLNSVKALERYSDVGGNELILILPKHNGSRILLERVQFDGEDFISEEVLYENTQTEDGFGLLLETVRPEGIPYLRLTLTVEGEATEYLVDYNGKDGTPDYEWLGEVGTLEAVDMPEEVIAPMEVGDYLEGMNLIYRQPFAIDDMDNTSIDLYCEADFNAQGELMLDDGQMWSLVVQREDVIYPVFPKDFVQLGDIGFTYYKDYDTDRWHILIEKTQGAGITLYDVYYEAQVDLFISQMIYQTEGNIGVYGQYP